MPKFSLGGVEVVKFRENLNPKVRKIQTQVELETG